jgi:hypothetical protein
MLRRRSAQVKKVTKNSRPKNVVPERSRRTTPRANKETIELYVDLGLKQIPAPYALQIFVLGTIYRLDTILIISLFLLVLSFGCAQEPPAFWSGLPTALRILFIV